MQRALAMDTGRLPILLSESGQVTDNHVKRDHGGSFKHSQYELLTS